MMKKLSSCDTIGIHQFDLSKTQFHDKLGEGAFGKVRLATVTKQSHSIEEAKTAANTPDKKKQQQKLQEKEEKQKEDNEEVVAIKILSKHMLIEAKQVDHVYNEMTLTSNLQHPFIVNLRGIQQDSRSIYIMMENIEGGELFKIIQRFKKLEQSLAKFYAAQIILVFELMHDRHSLIYRDLKPENVLVQSNGYCKLSDFGFVKKLKPGERTYTLCGTPEYLAPEILLNKGHGKPVDWYCLGMFLYEMMVGRCPFMNDDPYEIFKMILQEKIRFPKDFPDGAKSIIKHLTDHDLSKRYGNLKHGTNDIKKHRFFKDIDFDQLEAMRIKPLYIPNLEELQVKRASQLKVRYNHSTIPENKDNIRSPELSVVDDPFNDWFKKQ